MDWISNVLGVAMLLLGALAWFAAVNTWRSEKQRQQDLLRAVRFQTLPQRFNDPHQEMAFDRALRAFEAGRWRSAMETFRQIGHRAKDAPTRAGCMLLYGRCLEALDYPSSAEHVYRQVRHTLPYLGTLELGRLCIAQGTFDEADRLLAQLTETSAQAPGVDDLYGEACLRRAHALAEMGEREQAETLMTEGTAHLSHAALASTLREAVQDAMKRRCRR